MQDSRTKRRLGTAICFLAIIHFTACAKPPPPVFERLDLQAEVAKDDEGKLEGDLEADSALKLGLTRGAAGTVVGGTGGALFGFAIGASCGPLAPFCSVIGAIAFGGAGAVGGLVVGGVGGSLSGLNGDIATQVTQELERVEGSRDLTAELQTSIDAAVPSEKQAQGEQAQAIVTARIDSFEIRQHFSSRLSLRTKGSMTQAWKVGSETETKTCDYNYSTPVQDVEDWLIDDGAPFDEAFSNSVETLAAWMARDLEAFSTRQAQPKSEEFPETCYQP